MPHSDHVIKSNHIQGSLEDILKVKILNECLSTSLKCPEKAKVIKGEMERIRESCDTYLINRGTKDDGVTIRSNMAEWKEAYALANPDSNTYLSLGFWKGYFGFKKSAKKFKKIGDIYEYCQK